MSKVLSTFLLIIFVILALTIFANLKPAFASHTIDDSVISITQDLIPVKTDSGSVTFTIDATRDIFDTSQDYSVNTWNPNSSLHKDSCPESQGFIKPVSARQMKITSTIAGCRAELGSWKLEVWLGKGTDARTSANMIIMGYDFEVTQAGGGTLQIIPVKTPLGLSETPQVNLINGRNGITYTFWWDGAQRDSALKYPATADGNANNLTLKKVGSDFTKAEVKTLCMEVGDYNHLIGVTCRYRGSFDFKAVAPPAPPSGIPDCSIQPPPPGPVKDDSVSINVKNLPLTPQDYRADLIKGTATTSLPARQNSGSFGTVILNLDPHLDEGNYTAKVYDGNNQFVCSKDFTVGPRTAGAPTAPIPAATPCTGPNCSSGGGEPCDKNDPRGPNIKTAIGCIHTNPAEFVKDFLTFIVTISGGLAFLMMLLGAFGMLTSAGNPEALNAGRERLTSAIIGLLFVIFAILLMQIIGVGILHIPGFT